MIDRAGKKWNTAPERNFDEYQKSRGMGLMMNQTLPFVAEDRLGKTRRYDFQCDFLRPKDSEEYLTTGYHDLAAGYDVDYELDGEGHKSCNDPWKDAVKNGRGLKVVHIPGYFAKPKYWPQLDKALNMALLSPKPTVYLGLAP